LNCVSGKPRIKRVTIGSEGSGGKS